jgi:hypothetical protein
MLLLVQSRILRRILVSLFLNLGRQLVFESMAISFFSPVFANLSLAIKNVFLLQHLYYLNKNFLLHH